MESSVSQLPQWDDDDDVTSERSGTLLRGRNARKSYGLQDSYLEDSRFDSHNQSRSFDYGNYRRERLAKGENERSTSNPWSRRPDKPRPPANTANAAPAEEEKRASLDRKPPSSENTEQAQELKQWLLSQTDRFTNIVVSYRNVQRHIATEMEIDRKTIEAQLTSLQSRCRSASHYASLPREAVILEEAWTDTLQAFQQVMSEVCDCTASRKTAYQAQLKRVRDNANMAIRNAMQIERGETLVSCERMREDHEKKLAAISKQHASEIRALEDDIHSLRLTTQHLTQRAEQLQDKDQHRLSLQHEAVTQALATARSEHRLELAAQRDINVTETDKLRREHAEHIEQLRQHHESALERFREQEQALRHSWDAERAALEADILQQKQELQEIKMQLVMTKESAHHQLQAAQSQGERALSEQLAESLRVQATLKADIAHALQQEHMEKQQRQYDTEAQIQRLRDHLVQQHALEVEKLHDHHRRDMKRLQAELEIRHEDEMVKQRHMHEQELHRQIRSTERLQRIVQRHGLSTASWTEPQPADGYYDTAVNTHSTSNNHSHSHSPQRSQLVFHSLTPSRRDTATSAAGHRRAAVDRTPSPPPPPPQPSDLNNDMSRRFAQRDTASLQQPLSTSTATRSGSGLAWGKLRESLQAQEAAALDPRPRFSPRHAPPSTLDLDAALAASQRQEAKHKQGTSSSNNNSSSTSSGSALKGMNVAGNVRRVSTYLQALEDYLEGDDKAARDLSMSSVASSSLGDIIGLRPAAREPEVGRGRTRKSSSLMRHQEDDNDDEEDEDDDESDRREQLSQDSLHTDSSTSPLAGMRVFGRNRGAAQRSKEASRTSSETVGGPDLINMSLSDT